MQRGTRVNRILLALAASSALSLGALAAAEPPASSNSTAGTAATAATAGSGVTFINSSNHLVQIYAFYGSDASCSHRPKHEELSISAGQNATIDSADSKVCFCMAPPERGNCSTGWADMKPGSKRRFQ